MIDRSEYRIAGLAALSGWGVASKLMALWAVMEPWVSLVFQTALQGLITLVIGLGAVAAQHYVRRYLHKVAPIEQPRKNEQKDDSP